MRNSSDFSDGLITLVRVNFDNHNGLFTGVFPSNSHLGDIDAISRQNICDKGNHSWNVLVDNDESWCIHLEIDRKTIEFSYLDIPSTDRNTCGRNVFFIIF